MLDGVAVKLKQYDQFKLSVQAHTDSGGPAVYNQNLSKQRARTVSLHLISSGINPDRLDARAYGESRPVASNASAEGRKQNRRVELFSTRQQVQ